MAVKGGEEGPGQERIYVAGEAEYEREALVPELGIPANRSRRDLQTVRDELDIVGYETSFWWGAQGALARQIRVCSYRLTSPLR